MDKSAYKESRVLLRRIEDDLLRVHLALGAQQQSLGMVDVIHHPRNPSSELNYAAPRKGTAWIPGNAVTLGMECLRQLERAPRFIYIEGLFPAEFGGIVAKQGFVRKSGTPIMVYSADDQPRPARAPSALPAGVELVSHSGAQFDLWASLKGFDVLTLGVEPLAAQGKNYTTHVVSRAGKPLGVVLMRIDAGNAIAHVVALALRRRTRTQALARFLLQTALQSALARGCTLVFAPGKTDADHRIYTRLGFVDLGAVVCYAAGDDAIAGKTPHDRMAQPVLSAH